MKTFIVFSAVVACAVAAPGAVLLNSLVSSPLALGRTVSIGSLGTPLALGRTVVGAPLAIAPAVQTIVAPAVTSSQYHAQDELGQYSYGYAGGPSAKSEVKTADGITRGGYSYVDANGVVQTVNYVSDALGFRVAATNLPVAPVAPAVPQLVGPAPVQETPEVAAARAAHLNAVKVAAAAAAAAPDN